MSDEFIKPILLDEEIILDPTKEIMSKTDAEGIFEFVNEYFVEVSGYEEYELLGKSMHCTQHPDMPDVIFKMLWEKLLQKQNFNVLVKNLSKSGKYYWAISDYAFKDDENGNLIAIYNRRKVATREAIAYFDKLYTKLKDIEKESGFLYSEKYLEGHLEERGKTIEGILTEFQSNITAKTITPVATNPIEISVHPEITIDSTQQNVEEPMQIIDNTVTEENISIKERLARIKALQEQTKLALDKSLETKKVITPPTFIPKVEQPVQQPLQQEREEPKVQNEIEKIEKKPKKAGLFQKLFGKTEEELEAEKNRKK